MDQFIGEVDCWNKGIGTLLVTTMVQHLLKEKGANKVIMDPKVTNIRALRCYEKAGFKKIRKLLNFEFHEGAYRDCWLLEFNKNNE
ncbi:MAG: GNAT family N-acetyltransferase [Bacillota bacterium]|nr:MULTISPECIES: GNAT family N-acetyltransferase [unclassified Virgibacillus]MDY7045486.1 GNAT family N-acetyltransferase [Virgibacillus sp. M23]